MVVVPLEAEPAIDAQQVCVQYSDGHFLRIIDVYDMINEELQPYVQVYNIHMCVCVCV